MCGPESELTPPLHSVCRGTKEHSEKYVPKSWWWLTVIREKRHFALFCLFHSALFTSQSNNNLQSNFVFEVIRKSAAILFSGRHYRQYTDRAFLFGKQYFPMFWVCFVSEIWAYESTLLFLSMLKWDPSPRLEPVIFPSAPAHVVLVFHVKMCHCWVLGFPSSGQWKWCLIKNNFPRRFPSCNLLPTDSLGGDSAAKCGGCLISSLDFFLKSIRR